RTRRGRYLCKGGRWNDRRKNPLANVRAGIAYDSDLYDNHFQDWGLAAQAHHAGEVNVKRGVSKHIEYKTRKGKRRGRIISWKNVNPAVIEREDAGWIKIMQDGPARRFMESLADESALYLPKSQAMWRLYRDRGSVLKNPAIK
ncbi:MAG: hypothetical protein HY517_02310, partial [Candidatus Aenigmarchaeota archaeon]|nr:hypothetical protein [Candidatus Aenigmarchaeota archaeon]